MYKYLKRITDFVIARYSRRCTPKFYTAQWLTMAITRIGNDLKLGAVEDANPMNG